jgi:CheY-like chemotaxis protein
MNGPVILLVEDNQPNAYLASYLLEAAGFTVAWARHGREALEWTRGSVPDLILTDIQMPEMDGYELGRRLKADPRLAGVPLVAATSYAMVGDRERALAIGFDAYLEKPFVPESFAAEIARLLFARGCAP